MAMVETYEVDALWVSPAARRTLLPAPYDLDVGASVAAATALQTGDELVVYYRMPGSGRMRVAWAVFLAFSGDSREGPSRQTLLYRYVDDCGVPGAPRGFVWGCCGSVVATRDTGRFVAMHSWGPSAVSERVMVGGEYQDQADGTRQRVGGHSVRMRPRDLVEAAELSSMESWMQMSRDGLKPDMYEQAVSIFAVKESLLMWGML